MSVTVDVSVHHVSAAQHDDGDADGAQVVQIYADDEQCDLREEMIIVTMLMFMSCR